MAVEISYAAKAAITASIAALANGSAWQTPYVDNAANKFLDALLRILTNGQASGTGLLNIYVYASLGDGTYTDGAIGTDAAFTAANLRNSPYLGSVQMNAATAVQWIAPRGIASLFGGILPERWGLIFVNNSGASLSATGGDHVVEYQGIEATT